MNKKKKQFDKLKLKLKNLYFKKLLSIVHNKPNLNLTIEKNTSNQDLQEPSKDGKKSDSVVYVKDNTKPNIVINKIFNNLPDIVNKFGSQISNFSISKLNLAKEISKSITNANTAKLNSSNFKVDKKIPNLISINKEEPSYNYETVQNSNSQNVNQNLSNKIEKNTYTNLESVTNSNSQNVNQNLSNKIEKNTYTNLESVTNNNSIFTNTAEKINEVKNKIYKFVNNLKFKYIEKPNEIKNINLNQIIQPSNEIDIKTHFIPSEKQIKTIKEKLITSHSQNFIQNTKKYVSENLVSKIFNVNNNSETNKLEKQNNVYVLPAFQDGSDTPLENDIIGKIHKNELILNEKETRRLVGDRSGIVPNEPNTDLTPKSIEKQDSQEVQDMKINSSDFEKNDSFQDKILKPDQKIEPSEMVTKSAAEVPIDKNRLHIKKSLRNTLKTDIIQKNRMIPDWRSSYG